MQRLPNRFVSFGCWGMIFLFTLLPWAGLLLEEAQLELLFVHGSYWILTAYLLGLGTMFWLMVKQERARCLRWVQQQRKFLIQSLLLALALTTVVVSTHEVFFKTLSDETNLLSVSRSLLTQKQAYNITEGMYYYENLNVFGQTLPKRPLLFPYLTHLFHLLRGYDWQHPFYLNQGALFALLWSLLLGLGSRNGLILAFGGALLVVSSPLLGLQATSGGFDVFSLCWLGLSTFWLALGLGQLRPNQPVSVPLLWFGLWWTIGFVQLRYENSYLLLGAGVCYLILRRPRWENPFRVSGLSEMSYRGSWLLMSSWLLALSQWQTALSSGKYVEAADGPLLSLDYLPHNLSDLLTTLFVPTGWGDQIHPPYRPLLWLLLLAGLSWQGRKFWSHHTISKFSGQVRQILATWRATGLSPSHSAGLALLALLLAQQLLYLLHYFGQASHPSSARFFLPLTLAGSLILWSLGMRLPLSARTPVLILTGLLLCLLYLPQSQQGRFIHQLLLNRETRVIYDTVLGLPQKNTLFIHDRPGQILVLERGAVSVQRASQEFASYQQNLRQGLISSLIYLRQSDSASLQDQQLLQRGEWIEADRFMINPSRQLQVLRLQLPTE